MAKAIEYLCGVAHLREVAWTDDRGGAASGCTWSVAGSPAYEVFQGPAGTLLPAKSSKSVS